MDFTERERELITNALYMLESACYGDELHYEIENDLNGVPNPDEVRKLMGSFKEFEDGEHR